MKRTAVIIFIAVLMLIFTSCAAKRIVKYIPQPVDYDKNANDAYQKLVGICLDSNAPYNEAFTKAAEKYAAGEEYEITVASGKDGAAQAAAVSSMIKKGASAMLIIPTDPDALTQAAEECTASGISVINLLDSINARTVSYIAPDYIEVGAKFARLAKEAKKDRDFEKLKIFLLQTEADSFTMQLMHDGFTAELGDEGETVGTVNLENEDCDLEDMNDFKGANVIICYNEQIAASALNKTNNAAIICFGASADTLSKVKDGSYYASVFFGIDTLAQNAITQAVHCAESSAYIPPEYIELPLGVASESSVDKYIETAVDGFGSTEAER